MDFAGKNVLIAGGAGFIGTNLALALAARNARLRLTIHEKPLQVPIPHAEVMALDLRQPEHCAQAVGGMDYVFLCAAHTSGAAVIRATPLVHITPNVLINTLMLEAAHRAKVARFCFISSGAAYPPTADRPVREAEMFDGDPHEVYFAAGWMKRYAEILCRTYAEKIPQPMPTVVVRPSNVYGPYDKFDFAVSHVTAALIRRVVERQNPSRSGAPGGHSRPHLRRRLHRGPACRVRGRPSPIWRSTSAAVPATPSGRSCKRSSPRTAMRTPTSATILRDPAPSRCG